MAARSTLIRLHNRTPYTLRRIDANLDHGAWTDPHEPPPAIAPGSIVLIESESSGIGTGTEGTFRYASDGGGELYFHWDNPFVGRNSYSQSAPTNSGLCFGGGTGNNADLDLLLVPTARVAIRGFLPSSNGFQFSNKWPDEALIRLIKMPDPFGDITIGNASNGICGGMVYAVADYYAADRLPPSQMTNPAGIGDPLFDYRVNRLIDSFELPGGPLKYYQYMEPAYPDTPRVDAVGRSWVMAHESFPAVMGAIDAGRLCPLGLVMIKSLLPTDLGHNHQVLAYAYQLNGGQATLWLYDPNSPGDNNVTMSFDLSNASERIEVTHNVDSAGPIYAFFPTSFTPRMALGGTPSLRVFVAQRRVTAFDGIRNEMHATGVSSIKQWFQT
jgi:Aegerolysin